MLGIFGDSWAKTITSAESKKFHDGHAWWELLSEKYEVTNFGVPGSSVYFSYEEFNKHYSNFDKIIFLATEPGRLTFEVGSEIKNPRLAPEFKRHCNSYGTADYYSKVFNNSRFPEDSARFNAAKEYFLWLLNRKEQKEYRRLMLNEIKNLRFDCGTRYNQTTIYKYPINNLISTPINNIHLGLKTLTWYYTMNDDIILDKIIKNVTCLSTKNNFKKFSN